MRYLLWKFIFIYECDVDLKNIKYDQAMFMIWN